MKDAGFPWTQVGAGPEQALPADFAARVIDKAQATRARNRRAKLGLGASAGLAALVAICLWIRPTPPNLSAPAQAAVAITGFDTAAWSDEQYDLSTVLMPSARQAEKFDTYYGAAAWDTYASWDRDSYDASIAR
ncbi:MAG TPA: hypothetical protein VN916_06600 [Candidatus Acidoferrum sp.]|nr:hypothetical protein [Candidatus Acidoferrum sp.]